MSGGGVLERSKIVRRFLKEGRLLIAHRLILNLANGPDESRQFARHGPRGDNRFLVVAIDHSSKLAIQSLVGRFGNRDHGLRLSLASLLDRFAGARTMTIMPGRFHQHAS